MELFQKLNGRCPVCGGQVGLIEGLVFDYVLSEEGFISDTNSETYRAVGYCSKCKDERFVIPNNDGSYTVYHPDAKAIPDLINNVLRGAGGVPGIKKTIFDKCSNVLETMHLDENGNPFVESEDKVEEPEYEIPF